MIIYSAYNFVSGKIYIGQTTKELNIRKSQHYCASKTYDCYFYRALKKYPKSYFTWEIIDTANSIEELNDKEIFWINFYKANKREHGYNSVDGGNNKKPNAETRLKMSISGKNKIMTEEHKLKLHKPLYGKDNHFFGKKHTEETKRKISNKNKGKKRSPETIEQSRIRVVGKLNPFYGKKHSEETKAKLRAASASKVGEFSVRGKKTKCIELDEIFVTAKDCAEKLTLRFNLKFQKSKIASVCNKKRNHHRNFHFEYVK